MAGEHRRVAGVVVTQRRCVHGERIGSAAKGLREPRVVEPGSNRELRCGMRDRGPEEVGHRRRGHVARRRRDAAGAESFLDGPQQ